MLDKHGADAMMPPDFRELLPGYEKTNSKRHARTAAKDREVSVQAASIASHENGSNKTHSESINLTIGGRSTTAKTESRAGSAAYRTEMDPRERAKN